MIFDFSLSVCLCAEDVFQYENFFVDQIMKKKKDYSYRIFKKVARDAKNFPYANELSNGEKRIKVWCSNDYMGITMHPEVKRAIMLVLCH